MKSHKWDSGDPVQNKVAKAHYQVVSEANTIPYDNDAAIWTWENNRPVRCTTGVTIYRNTTRTGLTVTDTGLESSTSFKDSFGAHASKGDVNVVIGHTTPGKLVFADDCGENNRHGICPDANRNNLTESPDSYKGTVLVHLNDSMWKQGCCVHFVPEDTTLVPYGLCRIQFVEYCSAPPPPSPPPPSPPSPPPPSPPPFPPPPSPPTPP